MRHDASNQHSVPTPRRSVLSNGLSPTPTDRPLPQPPPVPPKPTAPTDDERRPATYRRANVEPRRDNARLVDAADQFHDDFPRPVVVQHLELANVTILLHHLEELDHHLRRRSQQHLPLATLLSVRHRLQAVRKRRHPRHGCEWMWRDTGGKEWGEVGDQHRSTSGFWDTPQYMAVCSNLTLTHPGPRAEGTSSDDVDQRPLHDVPGRG